MPCRTSEIAEQTGQNQKTSNDPHQQLLQGGQGMASRSFHTGEPATQAECRCVSIHPPAKLSRFRSVPRESVGPTLFGRLVVKTRRGRILLVFPVAGSADVLLCNKLTAQAFVNVRRGAKLPFELHVRNVSRALPLASGRSFECVITCSNSSGLESSASV